MSLEKQNAAENAVGGDTTKASAKSAPKGYTNPALKAMGISRIRLPSRNWTIFLSVTGLIIGGIVYDKREQKKVREKWMDLASKYGKQVVETDQLPRKITIFISPPPNDYLEESFKLFRRHVKPVLNAGGVDFEIIRSSRQGEIRRYIAGQIRAVRRHIKELEAEAEASKATEQTPAGPKIPGFVKKPWNYVASFFVSEAVKQEREAEVELQKKQEFEKKMKNLKNVLSIYYKDQNKQTPFAAHYEDSLPEKPLNQIGGVLCFGRGIYKEYLAGLHEGLLGPLQKPPRVIEQQALDKQKRLEKKRERELSKKKNDEDTSDIPEVKELEDLIKEFESQPDEELAAEAKGVKTDKQAAETTSDDDNDDDEDNEPAVIAPYILPKEYHSEGKLAPELKEYISNDRLVKKLPSKNNVPPFFQQPISVMPVPHLLGFLKIPERIYRFYQRRYLADEYGRLAFMIVEQQTRPFDIENDENLAVQEEADWPAKWVQKGKDKDSEWLRDMVVDKRVISSLWVFNDKLHPSTDA